MPSTPQNKKQLKQPSVKFMFPVVNKINNQNVERKGIPPVSLDEFKSLVKNIDDIAAEIKVGDSTKSHEQCIEQFHYDFYFKPEIRDLYSIKLRACPSFIRQKFYQIPNDEQNDVNANFTKAAEKEVAAPSIVSNEIQKSEPPVSFKTFSKFVTNLNEIAAEISKNEQANKSLNVCAKQFFHDYYNKPEIREMFPIKLKPCPANLRAKFLKTKEDKSTTDQKKCNEFEHPTCIQKKRKTKYPVDYKTFKKHLKHKGIVKLLIWRQCNNDVNLFKERYNNADFYEKVLHSYYVTFYRHPNRRGEFKYKFIGASRELLQKLMSYEVVMPPSKDEKTSSNQSSQTKQIRETKNGPELLRDLIMPETLRQTENIRKEIASENSVTPIGNKTQNVAEVTSINEENNIENESEMHFSGEYIYPVSLETFKKYINYDFVLRKIIKSVLHGDPQKRQEAHRDPKKCDYYFMKYYKIFYEQPHTSRQSILWNFDKAPDHLKAKLVAHAVLKSSVSKIVEKNISDEPQQQSITNVNEQIEVFESNLENNCETNPSKILRVKESNVQNICKEYKSNNQTSEEYIYPVSLEIFKKYINYDFVLRKIIKSVLHGDPQKRQEAHRDPKKCDYYFMRYYKMFYEQPYTSRKSILWNFDKAPDHLKAKLVAHAVLKSSVSKIDEKNICEDRKESSIDSDKEISNSGVVREHNPSIANNNEITEKIKESISIADVTNVIQQQSETTKTGHESRSIERNQANVLIKYNSVNYVPSDFKRYVSHKFSKINIRDKTESVELVINTLCKKYLSGVSIQSVEVVEPQLLTATPPTKTKPLLERIEETIFQECSKNFNIQYLLCTTKGLQLRICQAIKEMSFDEFKANTGVYNAIHLYNDIIKLRRLYTNVIEKNIWPINLYVQMPKLLSYLQSKNIILTDFSLRDISPQFLHWHELIKYTNFDECVRYDYYRRNAKTLIDDCTELSNERVTYYERCATYSQWISQVPRVIESNLIEQINFNAHKSHLNCIQSTLDATEIANQSNCEEVANVATDKLPAEQSQQNVEQENFISTVEKSTTMPPPVQSQIFVDIENISFVQTQNLNVRDPLNETHLSAVAIPCEAKDGASLIEKQIKTEINFLNDLCFTVENNTYQCEQLDKSIVVIDDDDLIADKDLRVISSGHSNHSPVFDPKTNESDTDILSTTQNEIICSGVVILDSEDINTELDSVAAQNNDRQINPESVQSEVQEVALPTNQITAENNQLQAVPRVPNPIRRRKSLQAVEVDQIPVPKKKPRLNTEFVPQLRHEFRPLPIIISKHKSAQKQSVAPEVTASQALSVDNTLFDSTQLLTELQKHNDAAKTTSSTEAAAAANKGSLSSFVTMRKVNLDKEEEEKEIQLKQKTNKNIETTIRSNIGIVVFHELLQFHYFKRVTKAFIAQYNLDTYDIGSSYQEALINSHGASGSCVVKGDLLTCLFSHCSNATRQDLQRKLENLYEFHYYKFSPPPLLQSSRNSDVRFLCNFMRTSTSFGLFMLQYKNESCDSAYCIPMSQTNLVTKHVPFWSLSKTINPKILAKMADIKNNLNKLVVIDNRSS